MLASWNEHKRTAVVAHRLGEYLLLSLSLSLSLSHTHTHTHTNTHTHVLHLLLAGCTTQQPQNNGVFNYRPPHKLLWLTKKDTLTHFVSLLVVPVRLEHHSVDRRIPVKVCIHLQIAY